MRGNNQGTRGKSSESTYGVECGIYPAGYKGEHTREYIPRGIHDDNDFSPPSLVVTFIGTLKFPVRLAVTAATLISYVV